MKFLHVVKKGEDFGSLERNIKLDMEVRKFLRNNLEVDEVETGEIIGGFDVKKEIAKHNYKITVIIESS